MSSTPDNTQARMRAYFHRVLRKEDIIQFNKDTRDSSRIPFYLLPSVSMQPGDYSDLGKHIDPKQPWSLLIPPIKQFKAGKEELIKEIAVYFADRICEIQPEGPIALGGWSAGVIIMDALAWELQTRGRDVPLSIAVDRAPENTGILDDRETIPNKYGNHIHNCRQQGYSSLATIGELVTITFRHAALMIFRRQREQLDEIDKIEKAHPNIPKDEIANMRRLYAAALQYQPRPHDLNVLVVEASFERHQKMAEKWRTITSNVESVAIKGTHLSIVLWKDAEKLAELLNERLADLSSSYQPELAAQARRSQIALGNNSQQ